MGATLSDDQSRWDDDMWATVARIKDSADEQEVLAHLHDARSPVRYAIADWYSPFFGAAHPAGPPDPSVMRAGGASESHVAWFTGARPMPDHVAEVLLDPSIPGGCGTAPFRTGHASALLRLAQSDRPDAASAARALVWLDRVDLLIAADPPVGEVAWRAVARETADPSLVEVLVGVPALHSALATNHHLTAAQLARLDVPVAELVQHPSAPASAMRRHDGLAMWLDGSPACVGAGDEHHRGWDDPGLDVEAAATLAESGLGAYGWRLGDLAHVVVCVLPLAHDRLGRGVTDDELERLLTMLDRAVACTSTIRLSGAGGQCSTWAEWRAELIRLADEIGGALSPGQMARFREALPVPVEV